MEQTLTPDQLEKISEIRNPVVRRRFGLYFKLPQDLQQTIFSEETTEVSRSILKDKHNLNDKDAYAVARVVGSVILGEINIKNFVSELGKALGSNNSLAAAIAKDVNEQIFQPVRESLMQVHGIGGAQTRAASPAVSVPTPKIESVTEPVKEPSIKEDVLAPHPSEIAKREAEERRKALIERLKETSPSSSPVKPKARKKKKSKKEQQPSLEDSGPKAVTAAWNGNIIDLSKVPPRRSAPKG